MENIVVKDVSYQYTRRNENDEVIETLSALSALNFSIEAGSFVCILGHNDSENRLWLSFSMPCSFQQRVRFWSPEWTVGRKRTFSR